MNVTINAYRTALEDLASHVRAHYSEGVMSLPPGIERRLNAATELIEAHDALDSADSSRARGDKFVLVIPLPIPVTPLAKLISGIDDFSPGATIRPVGSGEPHPPIVPTPGDMIVDLREGND